MFNGGYTGFWEERNKQTQIMLHCCLGRWRDNSLPRGSWKLVIIVLHESKDIITEAHSETGLVWNLLSEYYYMWGLTMWDFMMHFRYFQGIMSSKVCTLLLQLVLYPLNLWVSKSLKSFHLNTGWLLGTYQYTVWIMCNVEDSLVTMAMLGDW